MLLNRVNSHRRAVIDELNNNNNNSNKNNNVNAQSTNEEEEEEEIFSKNKISEHKLPQQIQESENHERQHEKQIAKETSNTNGELLHRYPSIPFYGIIDSISIVIKPFAVTDGTSVNALKTCRWKAKQMNGYTSNSIEDNSILEDFEKSKILQCVLNKLAQTHGNVYYLHCVCESERIAHACKRARDDKKIADNTITNDYIDCANATKSFYAKDRDSYNDEQGKSLRNQYIKYNSHQLGTSEFAESKESHEPLRSAYSTCKNILINESLCASSWISCHEYLASMHESISKMMELRTNVQLLNKMKRLKEQASPFHEHLEETIEYNEEDHQLGKEQKEITNYSTHHTITWSLSDHARWKDIIALLAIENEKLILFIYASSEVTQEYMNREIMRVTHTSLSWIEQATLVEEPRVMNMTDINPVVVMWNVLTHLPLTNTKPQIRYEESENSQEQLLLSKPSSILPFGVTSMQERTWPRSKWQERSVTCEYVPEESGYVCHSEQESSSVRHNHFTNGYNKGSCANTINGVHDNFDKSSKYVNDTILQTGKAHKERDSSCNISTKVYKEDIVNELLVDHHHKVENVNLTLLSSIPLTFASCCTSAFRFRHKSSLSSIEGEMNQHNKSNSTRRRVDKNYFFEWKSIGSRAPILPHFFSKLLSCLIEEVKLNHFELECSYNELEKSNPWSRQQLLGVSDLLQSQARLTNRESAGANKSVNVITPQIPFTKTSSSNRSKKCASLREKITRLSSLTWLEFLTSKQRVLLQEEIIDKLADASNEDNYSDSQIGETECEFLLCKLQFRRGYNTKSNEEEDRSDRKLLCKTATNIYVANRKIKKVNCLEKRNEFSAKDYSHFLQNSDEYDAVTGTSTGVISDNLVCTDNWGVSFKFNLEITRVIQENVEDDVADEYKS